jgi:hypothetical protein
MPVDHVFGPAPTDEAHLCFPSFCIERCVPVGLVGRRLFSARIFVETDLLDVMQVQTALGRGFLASDVVLATTTSLSSPGCCANRCSKETRPSSAAPLVAYSRPGTPEDDHAASFDVARKDACQNPKCMGLVL